MDTILVILVVILLIEVTYLLFKDTSGRTNTSRKGGVFVDTSALMDGRIVTAAQTGFTPSKLVVPKSVIAEMHLLADQADSEKRLRARRGLDAVSELQELSHLDVVIYDDGITGVGGVDERLIELAKKYNGSICTIDFNLNKVATAQGIQVLNINELAGNIRMTFLPGESLDLTLTQKGQESNQAVGYLADGTMVVVDKASSQIGSSIRIEVIRSLQTAAGRMLFAKPVKDGKAEAEKKRSSTNMPKERSIPSKRPQPEGRKQTVAQAKKPQARRKPSNRRSVEDSLIDLVNKQD